MELSKKNKHQRLNYDEGQNEVIFLKKIQKLNFIQIFEKYVKFSILKNYKENLNTHCF